MRQTHLDNPLHHIEYWTGSFFRAAHLWEVGVYILVQHHNGIPVCNQLAFQKEVLEGIQQVKDEEEEIKVQREQDAGNATTTSMDEPPTRNMDESPGTGDTIPLAMDEASGAGNTMPPAMDEASGSGNTMPPAMDNAAFSEMELEGDDQTNEDSETEDDESDLASINGYLGTGPTDAMEFDPGCPVPGPSTNVPRQDALNNHYVRVVHVNGVHHLALVTCFCHGAEGVHADLMYCRFMPASFSRYRTLFTVAVLDDFRITNLECKASAYQYFQKLRRLTCPTSPSRTPNLYQELGRMSRAWRWMKKLKWAGYGHKDHDFQHVELGELANFCVACPQDGINLDPNWKDDPTR
jgi:CxC2 like cysteine cluster associated with KDZ transposases